MSLDSLMVASGDIVYATAWSGPVDNQADINTRYIVRAMTATELAEFNLAYSGSETIAWFSAPGHQAVRASGIRCHIKGLQTSLNWSSYTG